MLHARSLPNEHRLRETKQEGQPRSRQCAKAVPWMPGIAETQPSWQVLFSALSQTSSTFFQSGSGLW
jgi:hypothetical protein